jgi:hypothetical protein
MIRDATASSNMEKGMQSVFGTNAADRRPQNKLAVSNIAISEDRKQANI